MKNLRSKINEVKENLRLTDEDFQLVRSTRYEQILHSMLERFTSLKPTQINNWWWSFFLKPVCSFYPENVFDALSSLINENELVWFVVEDESKKHERYWLYEGKIPAIISVLKELPYSEYYIVSKKLEWILCENHHNYLFGCGESIVEKMKVLKPEPKE